jgi:hypothetical protein
LTEPDRALWCVLRASAHNKLSAQTTDLDTAQALAADWRTRLAGPAVVLPEAERLAVQAAAIRRAVSRALLDPAPQAAAAQVAELTRQAERQALFGLLYRHLPFVACQPGSIPGTCYLLCFSRPYRHARHYLGWSEEVDARKAAHAAGQGARLMAVIAAAGISFEVVRTWPGTDRYFERLLKLRRRSTRLCPDCNPGNHRGMPQPAPPYTVKIPGKAS